MQWLATETLEVSEEIQDKEYSSMAGQGRADNSGTVLGDPGQLGTMPGLPTLTIFIVIF